MIHKNDSQERFGKMINKNEPQKLFTKMRLKKIRITKMIHKR